MKKLLLLLAMLSVALPSSVFAEESYDTRPPAPKSLPIRREIKKEVKEVREEAKEERENYKTEKQENQQKFVEDRKALVKEAQDKRASIKDDFKKKVEGIRDAAKKELAKSIGDRIQQKNADTTAKMAENLAKMSTILTHITAKMNTLPAGTDTTTLQADITVAANAIALAQAAVNVQIAVKYTLPAATTDSTAKVAFMALTQQLKSDLEAVQAKVKAARQAVEKAYNDLNTQ